MPRFSLMSHCQVCGREITQSGSARKWVHVDQFYARADHEPEPRENNKFLTSKKSAPAEAPSKPMSDAERRRKMREGASEPEPEKPRGRRPDPVPDAEQHHHLDIDDAARRLRRLRLGLDPDGED